MRTVRYEIIYDEGQSTSIVQSSIPADNAETFFRSEFPGFVSVKILAEIQSDTPCESC